jgi:hypothetical protein
MKRIVLAIIALALPACSNLTPEQNAILFNRGLETADRIIVRATK